MALIWLKRATGCAIASPWCRQMSVKRVRGMHDLVGDEAFKHDWLVETARRVTGTYGFRPIYTPIVEEAALFQTSLGSTSDAVCKEMYQVSSAHGEPSRPLALRPEATASVCRVLAHAGKSAPHQAPQYFYHGPMFRHEHPQKGRLRQFHQVGVEAFGGQDRALVDAQLIDCAARYLAAVGVDAQSSQLTLRLNSIGDDESRRHYSAALQAYLEAHLGDLSEDSLARHSRGSLLRILDSKHPADVEVVSHAPSIKAHLTKPSAQHLCALEAYLSALELPPVLMDERLVRGLDYYCDTVFEFTCTSEHLGPQQSTLLAGGRYHHLVEGLGGADVSGAGWACGLERLGLVAQQHPAAPAKKIHILIASDANQPPSDAGPHRLSIAVKAAALKLAHALRKHGLSVSYLPDGSLKAQIKRVSAVAAEDLAVFLGPEELQNQTLVLKDLKQRTEVRLPLSADAVVGHLSTLGQLPAPSSR